ncbi:MAG: hypothetical protein NT037_15260 [Hyphomicrobiales bacterium]|jgi:hypothetical protein|nr:hypothetical protein [Hyphomicrobiales bacterium]
MMQRVVTIRPSALAALLHAPIVAIVSGATAQAQSADQLVGRWGLAAYFREADAAKVTAAARGFCNHPYVIARGPNGGVMLNQPDQPQKSEHVISSGFSGRTTIGPASDASGAKDREFVSFTPNQFVLRWREPAVGNRYGVMVFVRCGGR